MVGDEETSDENLRLARRQLIGYRPRHLALTECEFLSPTSDLIVHKYELAPEELSQGVTRTWNAKTPTVHDLLRPPPSTMTMTVGRSYDGSRTF